MSVTEYRNVCAQFFHMLKQHWPSGTTQLKDSDTDEKYLECIKYYLSKVWVNVNSETDTHIVLNSGIENCIRVIDQYVCHGQLLELSKYTYASLLVYLYFIETENLYVIQFLLPLCEINIYRKQIFQKIGSMFCSTECQCIAEDYFHKAATLIALITNCSVQRIRNIDPDATIETQITMSLRDALNESRMVVREFFLSFISAYISNFTQKDPSNFIGKLIKTFVELIKSDYAAIKWMNEYKLNRSVSLNSMHQLIDDLQREKYNVQKLFEKKLNSLLKKCNTLGIQLINDFELNWCISYDYLISRADDESSNLSRFLVAICYIRRNHFNFFKSSVSNEITMETDTYILKLLSYSKQLKEKQIMVKTGPEMITYLLLHDKLCHEHLMKNYLTIIFEIITLADNSKLCKQAISYFIKGFNSYDFCTQNDDNLIRVIKGFLTSCNDITKKNILKGMTKIKSVEVLRSLYDTIVAMTLTHSTEVKESAYKLLHRYLDKTDDYSERVDILSVLLSRFTDVNSSAQSFLESTLNETLFDSGRLEVNDKVQLLLHLSSKYLKEFENGLPMLMNATNISRNTVQNISKILWHFANRVAEELTLNRETLEMYLKILNVLYRYKPNVLRNASETLFRVAEEELLRLFRSERENVDGDCTAISQLMQLLMKLTTQFCDLEAVRNFDLFIRIHWSEVFLQKLTVLFPYLSQTIDNRSCEELSLLQNLYLRTRRDLIAKPNEGSNSSTLLFLFQMADNFDFKNRFRFPLITNEIPDVFNDLMNLLFPLLITFDDVCSLALPNCVRILCRRERSVFETSEQILKFYENVLSIDKDRCLYMRLQVIKNLTELIKDELDVITMKGRLGTQLPATISKYTPFVVECYRLPSFELRNKVLCYINTLHVTGILDANQVIPQLIAMMTDVDEIKIGAENLLSAVFKVTDLSTGHVIAALTEMFEFQCTSQRGENCDRINLIQPIVYTPDDPTMPIAVAERAFTLLASVNAEVCLKGVLKYFTTEICDLSMLQRRLFHAENFVRMHLEQIDIFHVLTELTDGVIIFKSWLETESVAVSSEIDYRNDFSQYRYNAIWLLIIDKMKEYFMNTYAIRKGVLRKVLNGETTRPKKKRKSIIDFDINILKIYVTDEMMSFDDVNWKFRTEQIRIMVRKVNV